MKRIIYHGTFALLLLLPIYSLGEDTVLAVHGAVKNPLKLTLAEFHSLPQVTVRVKERGVETIIYEGVALDELLQRAGVPQGEALRGDAFTLCVILKAADDYQVLFALPEL